jgi:hypothetical protein
MKKIYYLLAVIFLSLQIKNGFSQIILNQSFTSGAAGWITSNGSSVGTYEDAGNGCISNQGIRTPGVGGNNPAKVLSEQITPTLRNLTVQFSIFRYDANLTCASRTNFGCNTYVDILLVDGNYSGNDPDGDGATIYANYSNYLLPIAGGTVTLNVQLPLVIPTIKIFFNFSAPGNCTQPGAKYILDDFIVTQFNQPCLVTGTCPPEANDDYFKAETQGFMASTLYGNVYGTNIGYTPPLAHVINITRSLINGTLSPLGGLDQDIDNHPLSAMSFSLLSADFTAAEATLTFNADGTFNFLKLDPVRLLYSFNYRLTDPNGNFDDAKVTVDYRVSNPLPVSLLNFRAVQNDRKAMLTWETASESGNTGFSVERQENGNFKAIAFIPTLAANGNSSSSLYYRYSDALINPSGIVNYRLKQIDKNGFAKYSEIRAVRFGGKMEIAVYPNPTNGPVNIVIPDEAGLVDLNITDINGKVVYMLKNTLLRNITVNSLQTGVYLVKMKGIFSNEIISQKLVVR